jgi:GNAT superfamily N-acetyltransferase
MTATRPDASNADVVAAIEANTQAAFARWATGLGADLHREPEVTWFASNLPLALCNGVIWAALPPARADSHIDATLSHFKERHVPLCWLVGPSSQPEDLGLRLEAHGFVHAGDGLGMAVDLGAGSDDAATPAGLTIVEVDDGATLRTWIDALCVGSDFPDEVRTVLYDLMERHGLAATHGLSQHPSVRLYLGLAGGEPVAIALLFLAKGVAGLYDVATVPHARRRGIGAALSRAGLRAARDLGYRLGVLQSSAMGEGVYRRLGFQQYCTLSLYFWSPD